MPADLEDRWTVGRLLSWTRDFLKKKGAESPRLDAEVLLAFVLGCERVRLYTQYEEEVGESDRGKFRDLVKRRADGTPVAYLVGRKEFYSLPLAVSPAVLIPRPDSEFVVVEFLARLKAVESPRCVDVGTGSGCLALACAQHHKSARFMAIDLSPEALAVARSNAEKLGLSDRVEFRQGDLLAPVAGDGPFDAIVSNPPYIATGVIPTLEPGVRDNEPHLALDGGEDGLRVVDRLIAEAVPMLKVGGHLILEIGSDQETPVRELVAARPELEMAPTIRDSANHPRVIHATRRSVDDA
ncbi:peptide chain release factor N(5)-glutamine methyltransferase [Tundrisphaera lichenicola]|uniref:peptide chain release factor N(5)-glutamine methyltransferase n=1 Tax=Tundrisphaera lichenicola TaxID=2029860 RepID=UPI003EBCE52B